MNIFDIIRQKNADEVLKQTENQSSQNKAQKTTLISQPKTYVDKFTDLLKKERSRFDYRRATIKPFENVTMKEVQRLHIMAKFINLYPEMTKQDFEEVLNNKLFESFKNLAEEYSCGYFFEDIKQNGSVVIAKQINSDRQISKLYEAIEEIDFNNDQASW